MESKRVAKPADIFVVAQSQMRGVWIQVPTLCMSVPCTCSAATDFKSTISSVKSSQRFAACLGITLGGLGLITHRPQQSTKSGCRMSSFYGRL